MIIDIFNSEKRNSGGAQLIFNSHNTQLLKPTLFRKDQIWFIEKDSESGISSLKSLSDFKTRPGENYEKNYRIGIYGAVPNINNKINLTYEISE